MILSRAGALLFAVTVSTLGSAGCRGGAQAAPPRAAAAESAGTGAAEAAPLIVADLAAYGRGRRRELALMRSALERLLRADGDGPSRRAAVRALVADSVERAGAAAAGLSPERYRALVERMDSALVRRTRATVRAAGGAAGGGDAASAEEWRLLDSLRVELAVLRTRFAAAAGDDAGAAR